MMDTSSEEGEEMVEIGFTVPSSDSRDDLVDHINTQDDEEEEEEDDVENMTEENKLVHSSPAFVTDVITVLHCCDSRRETVDRQKTLVGIVIGVAALLTVFALGFNLVSVHINGDPPRRITYNDIVGTNDPLTPKSFSMSWASTINNDTAFLYQKDSSVYEVQLTGDSGVDKLSFASTPAFIFPPTRKRTRREGDQGDGEGNNPSTSNVRCVLDPSIFPSSLGNVSSHTALQKERFLLAFNTSTLWRHSSSSDYVLYDPSSGLLPLLMPDSDVKPMGAIARPNADDVAFVYKSDIWINTRKETRDVTSEVAEVPVADATSSWELVRVTDDGDGETLLNGVQTWVYEEEVFSSQTGMWFSPDGQFLAYTRSNQSAVPVFTVPQYEIGVAYPSPMEVRYPKAGFPNPVLEVFVYDVTAHETHRIDLMNYGTPYLDRLKEDQDAAKKKEDKKNKKKKEKEEAAAKDVRRGGDSGDDDWRDGLEIVQQVEWCKSRSGRLLVTAMDRMQTRSVVVMVDLDGLLEDKGDEGETMRMRRQASGDVSAGSEAEPISSLSVVYDTNGDNPDDTPADGWAHIVEAGKVVVVGAEAGDASGSGWTDGGINDNPNSGEYLMHIEPRKSGMYHLVRSSLTHRESVFLTEGGWWVTSFVGYSSVSARFYFISTRGSAVERHVYSVTFDGTDIRQESSEDDDGQHSCTLDSTGAFLHISYSGSANFRPPRSYIVSVSRPASEYHLTLEDNSKLGDALEKFSLPVTKMAHIYAPRIESVDVSDSSGHKSVIDSVGSVAEGGEKMNVMITFPPNFDPGRRYPVIMSVYGGPGSQRVSNSYRHGFWIWVCSLDVILFSVDGRGTGFYTDSFMKSVYGQLGRLEAFDQMAAIAYLQRQDYVDPTRIGLWGWSYGGFVTSFVASHGPAMNHNRKMGMDMETFLADEGETSSTQPSPFSSILPMSPLAAALVVAPVTDFRFYDSIYTERYMRTPLQGDNPLGYELSSVVSRASTGNFSDTTAMLLVHGLADDNVHFQNSATLSLALDMAHYQFDQAYFPQQAHSINRYHVTDLLYSKFIGFLATYLKVELRPATDATSGGCPTFGVLDADYRTLFRENNIV
eukprot:TRINITY_DN1274_c0_g1_i1.p1 TRINITY_DN1274_c0_g1~~TRINITY_DN1274_c0_g1_i1.p1  ORF type:complete len:1100 (-),score=263.43 TRINITY_DN1274_c0_g1_i1:70-3369(-)